MAGSPNSGRDSIPAGLPPPMTPSAPTHPFSAPLAAAGVSTRLTDQGDALHTIAQEELAKRLAEHIAQHLQLAELRSLLKEIRTGTIGKCETFSTSGCPPPVSAADASSKIQHDSLQSDAVEKDALAKVCANTETVEMKQAGSSELVGLAASTTQGSLRSDQSAGPSGGSSHRPHGHASILASGESFKEEEAQRKGCLGHLSTMLTSKGFEVAVAALIGINALVMSFESQQIGVEVGVALKYPGHPRDSHWPYAEDVFKFMDWSFGVLFSIEMLMKLVAWRTKYFYHVSRSSGYESPRCPILMGVQGWNLLDFLCVMAFLADKILKKVAVNPQTLRLLRLFRLWRLVRLVRYLETVDHLYVMMTAISGLGKVLAWAICLLTIILLTCDLFLVQILQVTYFDSVNASDLDPDQLKRHHSMYQRFGTCSRCILTMFEITLGNWPPAARLLSEEVSEWFTIVMLLHKLTIGFAVVGVITGVILQETFKVAQTDDIIMFRQKKRASTILRSKMKRLFDTLDEDGEGSLSVSEFSQIGEDPEVKTWLSSLEIETDDLVTLFTLIDVENKGCVTLDELVARISRIKGNARSIDMIAMKRTLEKMQSV